MDCSCSVIPDPWVHGVGGINGLGATHAGIVGLRGRAGVEGLGRRRLARAVEG